MLILDSLLKNSLQISTSGLITNITMECHGGHLQKYHPGRKQSNQTNKHNNSGLGVLAKICRVYAATYLGLLECWTLVLFVFFGRLLSWSIVECWLIWRVQMSPFNSGQLHELVRRPTSYKVTPPSLPPNQPMSPPPSQPMSPPPSQLISPLRLAKEYERKIKYLTLAISSQKAMDHQRRR